MRTSKLAGYLLSVWLILSVEKAFGLSSDPDQAVYMMPMNCAELLPDSSAFVGFFASVARGVASQDKQLSRRLLKILSLREKVNDTADLSRAPNPVDTLIQKTICFYRVQKEPLKPIPFDEENFVHFLKTSLKDLETKVDDAVFQIQFEKYQREEYSRRVQLNRGLIQNIEREADKDADRSFEKLSNSAKRKARTE